MGRLNSFCIHIITALLLMLHIHLTRYIQIVYDATSIFDIAVSVI